MDKEERNDKILRVLAVIIVLLASLFMLGKYIASERFKPYKEALTLVNEAESNIRPQMVDYSTRDRNKYISSEREYVMVYKAAAELKLDNFPLIKGLVNERYRLNAELLKFDEDILSGKLKMTKEQAAQLLQKYNAKNKDADTKYAGYNRRQAWMEFFMVY